MQHVAQPMYETKNLEPWVLHLRAAQVVQIVPWLVLTSVCQCTQELGTVDFKSNHFQLSAVTYSSAVCGGDIIMSRVIVSGEPAKPVRNNLSYSR